MITATRIFFTDTNNLKVALFLKDVAWYSPHSEQETLTVIQLSSGNMLTAKKAYKDFDACIDDAIHKAVQLKQLLDGGN